MRDSWLGVRPRELSRDWNLELISNLVVNYYIASRATQSNSVYVSVLKIPIVLADGVSKQLRKNLFFRASDPCQRGEKYYISQ